MVSPRGVPSPSTPWRFALIGVGVSLPVALVVNRLPSAEATVGGSGIVFGAFVAGVVAALRSGDPDAAGLRAGLVGSVLAVLAFLASVDPTTAATWSPSRAAFTGVASVLVVCVAPVFGLGCGRVGGWAADTVAARWTTSANAPQ